VVRVRCRLEERDNMNSWVFGKERTLAKKGATLHGRRSALYLVSGHPVERAERPPA
jgi:hypothetical protein